MCYDETVLYSLECMRHAIAIDFGGTALKGAVIDEQGQIQARQSVPTESALGKERVMQNLFLLITTLKGQASGEVAGIGIGAPGPTQSNKGVVLQFPNVMSFGQNVPLRDIVSREFQLPVVVHNDANAAILGEVWMGAARDADSAVMLTLGTGIGGGVVVNRQIFDGGFGVGAELGHVRLALEGPACALGTPACLEALTSSTAVVRMARERIDEKISDSKQVYDLALAGNEEARRIWKEVGRWLGIAIGGFINVFNPAYLLIGGDMSNAWELFAPTMMHELERTSFPQLIAMAKIQKAQLGNDAGMYGMARAVFDASP